MKGFMRNIEVVLAIILVLTSFHFFINWGKFREEVFYPDRSAHELLRAEAGNLHLAVSEPGKLDSIMAQSLPSNLNYLLEIDYYSPFDYDAGAGEVFCRNYEFPSGTETSSIMVYNSRNFPAGLQAKINWYRKPFLLDTSDGKLSNERITLSLELPFTDSNSDGVTERPSPDSLELYLDGKKTSFELAEFFDAGKSTTAIISFNATIPQGVVAKGYLYYQAGEWVES